MPVPMKIAVAGATGRVGHHVVDVLEARGHDVVPMSRAGGVDLITGEGLAAALAGVHGIIDVATGPSPEEEAATEFFTTASHNLHEAGVRAGVQRMVVVSIIGCDRFTGGYGAAVLAHEQAAQSGPIPAHVLRAAQFHEFVAQLVEWGTQGEVSYLQSTRTQLVAARPSPRRSPTSPPPTPRRPEPGPSGRSARDRRPARGEPRRHGDAPGRPAR